jgi:hypothetical protein
MTSTAYPVKRKVRKTGRRLKDWYSPTTSLEILTSMSWRTAGEWVSWVDETNLWTDEGEAMRRRQERPWRVLTSTGDMNEGCMDEGDI